MQNMTFRTVISVFILVLFFTSCGDTEKKVKDVSTQPPKIIITKDAVLDSIIKRKKLRAVTDYGSLSYLIYRGEPIGYQYEMLKSLTTYLNVELELIIESN